MATRTPTKPPQPSTTTTTTTSSSSYPSGRNTTTPETSATLSKIFTLNDLHDYLYRQNEVKALTEEEIREENQTKIYWCDVCQCDKTSQCTLHGDQLCTLKTSGSTDSNLSAAIASFPNEVQLSRSSIPGCKYGVIAKCIIPKGTWLGPYEGTKVAPDAVQLGVDASYMWEIFQGGRLAFYLDGSNEDASSWMRFISCARNNTEQNLYAFQYCGNIYYRAFKEIPAGTELLVWYDDMYPQFMGIPLEIRETEEIYQRAAGPSKKQDEVVVVVGSPPASSQRLPMSSHSASNTIVHSATHVMPASAPIPVPSIHGVSIAGPRPFRQIPPLNVARNFNPTDSVPRLRPRIPWQPVPYNVPPPRLLTQTETRPTSALLARRRQSANSRMAGPSLQHVRAYAPQPLGFYSPLEQLQSTSNVSTNERRSNEDINKRLSKLSSSLSQRILTQPEPRQASESPRKRRGEDAMSGLPQASVTPLPVASAQPEPHIGPTLLLRKRRHSGGDYEIITRSPVEQRDSEDDRRDANLEENAFKCGQCGKTFPQRSVLQIHVCHKAPYKPYHCGHCDRLFSDPNELRNHAIIHINEKPFKCGYCSRSFSGATTLNNHIRTHTGEKPFECSACGKTFSQASQLSRHGKIPGDCID